MFAAELADMLDKSDAISPAGMGVLSVAKAVVFPPNKGALKSPAR